MTFLLLLFPLLASPQCTDPEPPLAQASLQGPLSGTSPGLPIPPPFPGRLIFPSNASQTLNLPFQSTILDFPSGVPARTGCPHVGDTTLISWNNASLWPGGVVPLSGDVTLPPNTGVLLSACAFPSGTLTLNVLTIPLGSRLVFTDSPLTLVASSIRVSGALTIGSPTCRFLSPINITLVGSRPAPVTLASTTSSPYTKGIVVDGAGGVLDLHGHRYAPTWTRLSAPGSVGDTWVVVQHALNWEAGQTIIITTTALKDSRDYSETEEVVLTATPITLPNGLTALRFTPPLRAYHYAGPEYQAEVGLLSRRLVVSGSILDSPPTDGPPHTDPANPPPMCPPTDSATKPYFTTLPCSNTSLTGYGGHVMVMGSQGAKGRVSGTLLLRMGQTNYMGRYPFHLHLLNSTGPQSYLADSAVWRSYYRCASLHGTNGATLTAVVAHDVTGHCFYLEDGVEEGNTLSYNLASLIHPLFGGEGNFFPATGVGQSQEFTDSLTTSPTLILPADGAASGFYITNAHNRYIGNAASGGWSGYSFPSLSTGINEHRYSPPGFSPLSRPTLEFRGNAAHSSGYWWSAAGCMYLGGSLTYGPPSLPPPPSATLIYNPGRSNSVNPSGASTAHGLTVFNDTLLYLCNGVGLQHWGAAPFLYGLETHDVVKAANFFGNALASDWLITCRTSNRPTFASPGAKGYQERAFTSSSTLFQSYDVGQSHLLSGLTFRNCSGAPPRTSLQLLQMLTHSDQFTPDAMIATSNVSFEGSGGVGSRSRLGVTVNATYPTVSHRMQNWMDSDGSISGRGSPTLLGSSRAGWWWWRMDSKCTNYTQWGLWGCDALPSRSVGSVTLSFNASGQSTPPVGGLGATVCSNGGWATIPCPAIGRVQHLGYGMEWVEGGGEGRGDFPTPAMAIPLNAKLTGPVGGFGWVIGGYEWRSPRVLNLTNPQVLPNASLLLVIPYPPGSKFTITAQSTMAASHDSKGIPLPSWCWVTRSKYGAGGVVTSVTTIGSNLCTWAFRAVGSVEEVRWGAGDTYFFDPATSHLYLRILAFSGYSFLGMPNVTSDGGVGVGRVWAVDPKMGWSGLGMSLPPRGSNVISVVTDCGAAGVTGDGMYCDLVGGNGGRTPPASPCPPSVSLPLADFDSCGLGGAASGGGAAGGNGGGTGIGGTGGAGGTGAGGGSGTGGSGSGGVGNNGPSDTSSSTAGGVFSDLGVLIGVSVACAVGLAGVIGLVIWGVWGRRGVGEGKKNSKVFSSSASASSASTLSITTSPLKLRSANSSSRFKVNELLARKV